MTTPNFGSMECHVCADVESFPLDKFHQLGTGRGNKILIVGESPAPNGWVISGKACYRPDGKILPTGKRLNEFLKPFNLSVEKVGFTELSKCFVSKRSELESCSKKCWPIFLNQIKKKKYKIIIILGVQTTKIFSKLISRNLNIGEITEIELDGKRYKIMPIFHPSPLNTSGHPKNLLIFKKHQNTVSKLLV